jgi:hypothetical protein
MKSILKNVIYVTAMIATTYVLSGCSSSGGDGVCVSSGAILGKTYCYNNFSKSECSDYDSQEVNGGSWFFHSGQTCSDRGLDEGSN